MSGRRKLCFALLIFVLIEGVAWTVDELSGFRRRLLATLNRQRLVNQPIAAMSESDLVAPADCLPVRSSIDSSTGEPYEIGGQLIPNARPSGDQRLLRADELLDASRERVFVVGGSAAFGFPYEYGQSFAALLDRELRGRGSRVVNASQLGAASGEIVPSVHRIVRRFAPDVLVVFSGNNEWIHWDPEAQSAFGRNSLQLLRTLSRSRSVSAISLGLLTLMHRNGGARSLRPEEFMSHRELQGSDYALTHPLDSSAFHPSVWLETKEFFLEAFETNLRKMVIRALDDKIRVIVLTVPFNYRLSPAWKHPQPESFDRNYGATVQHCLHRAANLMKSRRYKEALKRLDKAICLDPFPPLLHYLKGQCLEALQRPMDAERAYAQSRERMIGNLGSRLSINETIRKVAAETGAELVDVQNLFDTWQHQRGRYFNVDLIHDDCHPTPQGHQLIADELLRRLTHPENERVLCRPSSSS